MSIQNPIKIKVTPNCWKNKKYYTAKINGFEHIFHTQIEFMDHVGESRASIDVFK